MHKVIRPVENIVSSGSNKADMALYTPTKQVMKRIHTSTNGHHVFQASRKGDYRVCFRDP